MAELVDATVSNTVGAILTGSIPVQGTKRYGSPGFHTSFLFRLFHAPVLTRWKNMPSFDLRQFILNFAIMKTVLTIDKLQTEAFEFCKQYSEKPIPQLFGVTDGKAVGTYIEHLLKEYLSEKYTLCIGNTAKGLDLPSVDTDIKVTSVKQPQSSCPFKDSKQKIFGLGYNLLVLVYDKHDDPVRMAGILKFVSCCFVDKSRTADYQTTTGILKLLENNANTDDIFAFLSDRNMPGDDVTLYAMAEEVLKAPPQIGYLTISNALQWRLQYGRIVNLKENIRGINTIIRYDK